MALVKAEEIDLTQDMVDWEKLNGSEKHFLKHVLAFFAGSDGIVLENLNTNFVNEVQKAQAAGAKGVIIAGAASLVDSPHSNGDERNVPVFVVPHGIDGIEMKDGANVEIRGACAHSQSPVRVSHESDSH